MPEFKQPKKRRKRTPPPKAEQRRINEPVKQVRKKTNPPPRKNTVGQKRKKNLRLYYFLMFLIAAAIFGIMSVTVLFNLEEITVSGESGYSDDEIIDVSGLKQGQNIVRMNTESTANRLLDELIWLDSVTIDKKLPRTVIINVERAVPAANILLSGVGAEYYVISQTGRILEKVNRPRECVRVIGYEPDRAETGVHISTSNEKKAELLFELIELIESTGLENIVEIDMTDHLDIKLNYNNSVTVVIGSSVSLEQKLRHTREWLKTELNEGEKGVLRVKNLQKITFLPDIGEAAESITTPPETEPLPDTENESG